MTIAPTECLSVELSEADLESLSSSEPDAMVDDAGRQAPLVRAATTLDGQLVGRSSGPDQLLLDAFLRVRSRTKGPLVAVSDRTIISNAGASELLQPPDRRLLWEWAWRAMSERPGAQARLLLSSGVTVVARCKPVGHHVPPVGAVVQFSVSAKNPPLGARDDPSSYEALVATRFDASLMSGWVELTDAERTVTELVARGLTNKEAGRQMFLSHHTVDCHLRRVFRKLGVNSRVELARMMGEHYEALSDRSTGSGVLPR
jgi:DNA-binding CsgD family transcriptional regulator